ncbi:MAG: response regulator [bacterium]|jgi:CheY-like chemotaxis protein
MKNVLVVEDEDSLRLLYKQELVEDGYNVIAVDSGEDALERLDKNKIDLVVLDIRLGGMSGLEALEGLLSKQRDLKVVINTAYANFKDDFSSWLADAYVIKSADLSELKSTIHRLIN